jgi:hypothetical protein
VSSWYHCEGVEVIMNKGIALTYNGEDNELDKLRLGSLSNQLLRCSLSGGRITQFKDMFMIS